jgi:imidazolonepropionase-like amidohydrolase
MIKINKYSKQIRDMFFNRFLFSAVFFFNICNPLTYGQPAPAVNQKEKIAIIGGIMHIGNGSRLDNGCLIFDKGKIIYAGNDLKKADGISNKISAEGKHIYPGFICPATNLGLAEIELVKATIDNQELGTFNPNIRSLISYNTDSKIIPTVRSNGMLIAQVIPSGGIISGQSSIMQLDAWNWEDAVIKSDEGIYLNWPQPNPQRMRTAEPAEVAITSDRYMKEFNDIEKYFDEAFAYSQKEYKNELNLGYEALRELWTGKKKLYIRVNQAKQIIQSVLFAKKHKITPVIVGGNESWLVVEFLKLHNVSVILNELHNLPDHNDDDIYMPYKIPKILKDQGVGFCLSINGFWQQRNLCFQAGQTLSFGLSYEEAVASISLNAAKILGIDQQCGSLETGKDASFIISEGDALDMKSNNIIRAFIQGRDINLDNKQKELYRRFWSKYHPE